MKRPTLAGLTAHINQLQGQLQDANQGRYTAERKAKEAEKLQQQIDSLFAELQSERQSTGDAEYRAKLWREVAYVAMGKEVPKEEMADALSPSWVMGRRR